MHRLDISSAPALRAAPAVFAGALAAALAATTLGIVDCGTSTSSATVSAIAVSPSVCLVGRTDSKQLSAQATQPDGSKTDITSGGETHWSSANTNTATVNEGGVVVGVNAGVTKITVSYGGATGSIDCTVGP